jgi:hypothetical protein
VRLDADQLEWIVREVVRRLRGDEAGGGAPAPHLAELTIPDQLITVATLEGKLSTASHLRVSSQAVITPAARDLLKERNIELTRTSTK